MRHLPSSWSDSLLARLGFRRKRRRQRHGDQFYMRRRPQVESLEARQMLASDLYVVTTLADVVDANDGVVSLREAITVAATDDSTTDNDTIQFDASLFAAGPATITLAYDGADAGTVPDQLTLNSAVTIQAPGAGQLSISGNDLTRVLSINSSVTATIEGVTIRDGNSGSSDGGGISNAGNLTLESVVVTENATTNFGGGIFNNNTIRINNSTVSDNTALNGGGLYSQTDVALGVVVENSAIIDNDAYFAGGASFSRYTPSVTTGSARFTNSTVSGNEASGNAGGIGIAGGFGVTVVQSTVTNNRAGLVASDGLGGGFYLAASSLLLHNSIVAGNTADYAYHHDITGSWTNSSSSYNLIGVQGDSGLTNNVSGNLVGTYSTPLNAGLAPLGDYGGTTKTHSLAVNSPAIDKGSNALALDASGNPLTVDQRGSSRAVDLGVTGPSGGTVDIGALEFLLSDPLVVSQVTDEYDADYRSGDLSLREAVALAALLPGNNTITFDSSLVAAGPATLTLTYDGPDAGTTPDQLTIDSNVTIDGPGAGQLAISGNDLTRVLWVNNGVTATIEGLSIRDGNTDWGGGLVNSGNLTLESVVVTQNGATVFGGGIYNNNTIRISNSTISENWSDAGGALASHTDVAQGVIIENSAVIDNDANFGGAIYLNRYVPSATTGNARFTNSTFSGNDSTGSAGGIAVAGGFGLTAVNSTITNNRAGVTADGTGGGFWLGGSLVTLHNSIVAGNIADHPYHNDVTGGWIDSTSSYNFIGVQGDSGLTNNVNGNLVGTFTTPLVAALAPLGDYGGPTKTHALFTNSPAIDKGSNAKALDALGNSLTVDQRGRTRNVDSGTTGPSGGTVDMGAFEFEFIPPIIVSTLADEDDGHYEPGDLSLREALALANLIPAIETITFDEGLFANGSATITLTYDGNDSGTTPDQLNAYNVSIVGPGADKLTLSGGGLTRVLNVNETTIEAVTITGGSADLGAGIFGAGITLRESRVTGNTATSTGGGIHTIGSLHVENSEISDNTAATRGGGIFSYRWDSDYEVTIANSTISGNDVTSATGKGGGIYSYLYYDYGSKKNFTIANSTISNNSAKDGGGLFFNQKSVYDAPLRLKVNNTIIAGNADLLAAPDDVAGNSGQTLDSTSSYNLFGQGGSGGLTHNPSVTGNIVLTTGQGAGLTPLSYFGGPTRTHALLDDSPAIDAGTPGAAAGISGVPSGDQRGEHYSRVADGDINGMRLDIGAFESHRPVFEVSTLDDEFDGDFGPRDFSLREALALAALVGGEDAISFAPHLFESGPQSIILSYDGSDSGTSPDELKIDSDVSIEGPGAVQLSISGNNLTRVLQIGNGADATISNLTVTGGNAGALDGGGIYNVGQLTLDHVDVTESVARYGGGVYSGGAGSSLLVTAGRIVGNESSGNQGGGVYVAGGDVEIEFTTLDRNTATIGAGLYLSDAESFELWNSTVSRSEGTAVHTDASFSGSQVFANSTLSNNQGDGLKFGAASIGTGVTILNCTIADNAGRGIHSVAGTSNIVLQNSIVADNEGTSDVYGAFGSGSQYNVLGVADGSSGLTTDPNSDFGTIADPLDARLATLAMYGGTTETHALLANSPAIDSANESLAPATDQRGVIHTDFALVGGSGQAFDRGAFGTTNLTSGTDIVVTMREDRYADDPTIVGGLSLREALREAAFRPGEDTIRFAPSIVNDAGVVLLNRELGPLQLTSDVSIVAPGTHLLTINANGLDSVLRVVDSEWHGNSGIEINGLTLTGATNAAIVKDWFLYQDLSISNSRLSGNGSAILWNYGNVSVYRSAIDGNSNPYEGSSVVNVNYGSLLVEESEIARNSGGITAHTAGVTVRRSTIADNLGTAVTLIQAGLEASDTTISHNQSAERSAGIIANTFGVVTLTNVTMTNNIANTQNIWDSDDAAGGIYLHSMAEATLHNSIVAGNWIAGASKVSVDLAKSSSPFGGFVPTSSHNLIGYASNEHFTPDSGTHNQLGTLSAPKDAMLGPLSSHGGFTRTHALLPGSPAIDAGNNAEAANAGLTTDQRGYNRTVTRDTGLLSGNYIDIGAYEWGLTVTEAGDAVDAQKGHGNLTLREAIVLANVLPGRNEIEFDTNAMGSGRIQLSSQLGVSAHSDIDLIGPGADQVVIDARSLSGVMSLGPGADASISGLTISGGNAANGAGISTHGDLTLSRVNIVNNHATVRGGGVWSSSGSLTIIESTIEDNSAPVGAGISTSGGSLVVSHSSIVENVATGVGGGVHSIATTVDVENSTVSMNSASSGAGIYLDPVVSASHLILTNTTVAKNQAGTGSGGGIYATASGGGTLKPLLRNSLVADNTNGSGNSDVAGTFDAASSNNLIGWTDGSTGLATANNDFGNTDLGKLEPQLAPLDFYGGSRKSHAHLPNSPGINAGDNDLSVGVDGNPLLHDQNGAGFDRIVDGTVDIGASEAHVVLDGTALKVYGSNLGEAITVRKNGVRINRIGSFDLDLASVTEIFVDAMGGDDFVTIDKEFNVVATVHGGAGNDTIQGGSGDDLLYGENGNDTIYGNGGADQLIGGSGNDLLYGQLGNDAIEGGDGNDVIDGGAGTDVLEGGGGQDQFEDLEEDQPVDDLEENRAPVILWFGNPFYDFQIEPKVTANGGEYLVLTMLAYDPDGDDLTYELRVTRQIGEITQDVTNNFLQSQDSPNASTITIAAWSNPTVPGIQKFNVHVVAKDGDALHDTPASFELTVVPKNFAPSSGTIGWGDDPSLKGNHQDSTRKNSVTYPPYDSFGTSWAEVVYRKSVNGAQNSPPTVKFYLGLPGANSYSIIQEDPNNPKGGTNGQIFTWQLGEGDFGKTHRFEYQITNSGNPPDAGNAKSVTGVFYVRATKDEYSDALPGVPYTTNDNEAPTIARDRSEGVDTDGIVDLDLRDNYINVGGTSVRATEWTSPSHGSLVKQENGKYAYIPNAGYTGVDHLEYWKNDGRHVKTVSNGTTSTTTINPLESNRGKITIHVGSGISFDTEFDVRATDDPPNLNWLSSGPQVRTDQFSGNVRFGMPLDNGFHATYRPDPGATMIRVNYQANEEMHPEPLLNVDYSLFVDDDPAHVLQGRTNGTAVPAGQTGTFYISLPGALPGGKKISKFRQVGVNGSGGSYAGGVYVPLLRWVPDLRQDNFGFGDGWNLAGIERVIVPPGGFPGINSIYWIRSDGYVLTFDDFGVPANGDENASVIYQGANGEYGITDKYGNSTIFDEDGWIKRRDDRYGKQTYYDYEDLIDDGEDDAHNIVAIHNDYDRQRIEFVYKEDTLSSDTPLVEFIRTYPDKLGSGPDSGVYRQTKIEYDGTNRLSEIHVPIDGLNDDYSVTKFQYDSEGRLNRYEDADGKETRFDYQSDGNVVKTTYDDNSTTLLIRSKAAEFVGARPHVLNAHSVVTGASRAAGVHQFTLPAISPARPGVFVDELGRTSSFTTDSKGYRVEETDAAGRTTRYTRNSIGQITSETLLEVTEQGENVLDQTKYTYDSRFNLTSVEYFDGTSEHWTYDTKTFPISPLPGQTIVKGPARILSYIDQLGRQTLYTYQDYTNPSGYFKGEQTKTVRQVVGKNDLTPGSGESDDLVTTYEYDERGMLVMLREQRYYQGAPLGERRTKYEYTNPLGGVDQYEAGSATDFINGIWLKRVIHAEGVTGKAYTVEVLEYDEYGNPTKVEDGMDRVTQYDYDDQDRVISITSDDPDGSTGTQPTPVTEFEYWKSGRAKLVTETSVENPGTTISTLYEYDGRQRLQQVTEDYTGSPVYNVYEYDKAGNLTATIVDQLGDNRRTKFVYDLLDQPIQITEPDKDSAGVAAGPVTLLAYDALGRVVSSHNSQGNVTTYEYDKLHRLTKVLMPQGATNSVSGGAMSYTYDAAGQITSATDATGRVTTYEYDDAGRLTKVFETKHTNATENVPIKFEYDSVGDLRRVTDQLDHSTKYEYDVLSRLTKETDAKDKKTIYDYNFANELVSLIDSEDNTTTWDYDDAGRVKMETNELGHTRTYTYDDFNRLDQVIDRNGRTVQFDYDNFHRLDEERWYVPGNSSPVQTIDYDFNHLGELDHADALGTSGQYVSYDFTYNAIGQLEQTVQNFAGLTPGITFDPEYTDHLLKSTKALFDSFGITTDFINTYEYDALDRLIRIKQKDDFANDGNNVVEKRVDLDYDAAGRYTDSIYFNGLTNSNYVMSENRIYDERGRLGGIVQSLWSPTGDSVGSAEQYYSYDVANRLIDYYRTVNGGTEKRTTYSYDNRNQLTEVNYVNDFLTDESYLYDDNGNRDEISNGAGLNQNYQYDESEPILHNNQFHTDGKYNYLYDNEGNRTRKTSITTGDYTVYVWDHRNRLTDVLSYDDNNTPSNPNDDVSTKSVNYVYDPFNQMIKRTVDGDGAVTNNSSAVDQTFFLYDQGQVVLQFEKTGTSNVQAEDLKHRYLWGPAVDQLLADEQVTNLSTAGQTYWILSDHLGSIRDVVDSSGVVRIHRDFDGFGNIVAENHFGGYVDEDFAFTGRFLDDETGLQNNLNRWYDATTGRWMSEDPIGFAAGDANLNRYVTNSASGYTDPKGLASPKGQAASENGLAAFLLALYAIPFKTLLDVTGAYDPALDLSQLWGETLFNNDEISKYADAQIKRLVNKASGAVSGKEGEASVLVNETISGIWGPTITKGPLATPFNHAQFFDIRGSISLHWDKNMIYLSYFLNMTLRDEIDLRFDLPGKVPWSSDPFGRFGAELERVGDVIFDKLLDTEYYVEFSYPFSGVIGIPR